MIKFTHFKPLGQLEVVYHGIRVAVEPSIHSTFHLKI